MTGVLWLQAVFRSDGRCDRRSKLPSCAWFKVICLLGAVVVPALVCYSTRCYKVLGLGVTGVLLH